MGEPIWLRADVVRAIHQRQLAEHGGGEGVRDENLLASALARPHNLYHYSDPKPDMAALAACYACGVSSNHPFVDGNKRTAYILCQLFLYLNGYRLEALKADKYEVFMGLASGGLSEAELTQWLRAHIKAK